jgi:hypothetical protein
VVIENKVPVDVRLRQRAEEEAEPDPGPFVRRVGVDRVVEDHRDLPADLEEIRTVGAG